MHRRPPAPTIRRAAGVVLAIGFCGLLLPACPGERQKDGVPDHYAAASNAARLELARPPQRVVSLAPNLTEFLFALDAGDRVVGVTRYCDQPPEAATRTRVGGFVDPNFEAVVGLRPDLVVAVKNSQNRAFVSRLEDFGVPVYWTALVTEDDVFRVCRELAGLLAVEASGARLADSIRRGMKRVEERLAGAPRRRVMLVFGHSPLVVAGRGTFAEALLARAGGENVAGTTPLPYPIWSMEAAVRAAPEVIVDNYMGSGDESANRAMWEGWSSIPAVRDGRVHRLRATSTLRPGPRLAEALEELARLVHPERFAAPPSPGGGG